MAGDGDRLLACVTLHARRMVRRIAEVGFNEKCPLDQMCSILSDGVDFIRIAIPLSQDNGTCLLCYAERYTMAICNRLITYLGSYDRLNYVQFRVDREIDFPSKKLCCRTGYMGSINL